MPLDGPGHGFEASLVCRAFVLFDCCAVLLFGFVVVLTLLFGVLCFGIGCGFGIDIPSTGIHARRSSRTCRHTWATSILAFEL